MNLRPDTFETFAAFCFYAFVAAVIIIALCAGLSGCGGITSGEVLGRRFHPAHDEQQMLMIDDIPMFFPQHYPGRWSITIGQKGEDGKYRTREINVTEAAYRRYKTGDWASFE